MYLTVSSHRSFRRILGSHSCSSGAPTAPSSRRSPF